MIMQLSEIATCLQAWGCGAWAAFGLSSHVPETHRKNRSLWNLASNISLYDLSVVVRVILQELRGRSENL